MIEKLVIGTLVVTTTLSGFAFHVDAFWVYGIVMGVAALWAYYVENKSALIPMVLILTYSFINITIGLYGMWAATTNINLNGFEVIVQESARWDFFKGMLICGMGILAGILFILTKDKRRKASVQLAHLSC